MPIVLLIPYRKRFSACDLFNVGVKPWQAAEKPLISEVAATLRRHNFDHCNTHMAA
jgi:hypothetical protein